MQHVTDRTRGHNLGGHATTVDILVGFIVPSSIVLVGCCNVVVFVLVSVCLSLSVSTCMFLWLIAHMQNDSKCQ